MQVSYNSELQPNFSRSTPRSFPPLRHLLLSAWRWPSSANSGPLWWLSFPGTKTCIFDFAAAELSRSLLEGGGGMIFVSERERNGNRTAWTIHLLFRTSQSSRVIRRNPKENSLLNILLLFVTKKTNILLVLSLVVIMMPFQSDILTTILAVGAHQLLLKKWWHRQSEETF